MRRTSKLAGVIAAGTALALLGAGAAVAENIVNDIHVVDPDTGAELPDVKTSTQATTGQTVTTDVKYRVTGLGSNGCDAADGTPLVLTLGMPASVSVAAVTPLDSGVAYDAGTKAITFSDCAADAVMRFSTSAAGSHSISSTFTDAGVGDDALYSNQSAWTWQVYAPTVTNAAPTVALPAADVTGGLEGTQMTTGGSFADDGGASNLTITKFSGAGTVTPGASGAWTWTHTATDDSSGTVVVQATDAGNRSVTDSFDWTATNVAPVVGTVQLTATAACSVDLSAAFSDAGSGDTHVAGVLWGDEAAGTAVTLGTSNVTSPVTGSHTYSQSGTYTASVTVQDDDGGEHTNSSAAFGTKNTASSILDPIKAGGASNFKAGSTIPVKVEIKGCDGQPNTTITPAVSLVRIDSTVDGVEVTSGTSEVATNGKQMRYADGIYIYNLSSKLSQHTGSALSTGTYRVTVSEPSIYGVSPTEKWDLKK